MVFWPYINDLDLEIKSYYYTISPLTNNKKLCTEIPVLVNEAFFLAQLLENGFDST